ncbi:MAG TPA: zf-HC2 domain-containing protein [Gemmatimonadaceae bacterium]|nr:zf-HC2 domain-containing protein [Gemmatimonadaceae bacterium]
MNKCTDSDIQELLPDLLHGALAEAEKARVDAHVATCESCQEDLDVLRTVKSAAVFAPSIDVDRVVRQIAPYRAIVPAVEAPARTRVASWLVAATVALFVVGGGSVLMTRQNSSGTSVKLPAVDSGARIASTQSSAPSRVPVATSNPKIMEPASSHPHALALAAEADGLSDRGLVQLMNDMDTFDALPGSEPDPVISVDSGDSL